MITFLVCRKDIVQLDYIDRDLRHIFHLDTLLELLGIGLHFDNQKGMQCNFQLGYRKMEIRKDMSCPHISQLKQHSSQKWDT